MCQWPKQQFTFSMAAGSCLSPASYCLAHALCCMEPAQCSSTPSCHAVSSMRLSPAAPRRTDLHHALAAVHAEHAAHPIRNRHCQQAGAAPKVQHDCTRLQQAALFQCLHWRGERGVGQQTGRHLTSPAGQTSGNTAPCPSLHTLAAAPTHASSTGLVSNSCRERDDVSCAAVIKAATAAAAAATPGEPINPEPPEIAAHLGLGVKRGLAGLLASLHLARQCGGGAAVSDARRRSRTSRRGHGMP